MKKLVLTLLGAALMAGSASAQVAVAKVDVAKLRSAITKAEGDSADPKKGAKAAAWVSLGDAYVDSEAKMVDGLYAGMPENMLTIAFGEGAPAEQTVGGQAYKVYTYENVKVYAAGGTVSFWTPTTVVDPAALSKAYDAYDKAYTMDAKSAKKVGAGMDNIHARGFENGSAYYSLGEFVKSADNFRMAYRASAHATAAAVDTMSLYYAGMAAANGEDYAAAKSDLDQALNMGYEHDGETYYMKFLAQYNLGEKESSLATLQQGLARFPGNENIIDMMVRYYAENDGDVTSIIPIVEAAIAQNPTNPSLYQGLARVYDKLGQSDDAIATIRKVVELTPEDFLSNYLEGYFIVKKGDAEAQALGSKSFTNAGEYQAALAGVNNVFREAVAPLEKAYEINPEQLATVELLKNLTFRLREEPGMGEKYEKYNTLYSSMPAN
ncbi:MAG: tetratricopeptide repeat protein [Alistipes sp.]|jgi:tetratricopeptide (TPR) repeat protein|nr:tetratricopeptide repeat protein [Alistipes sp.]